VANAQIDRVVHPHSEPDAARDGRTGEFGSEGGSYGELTQEARAAHGDTGVRRSSPVLTIVIMGIVLMLVLMVVWFGSSLSSLLTAE
jgi:hypothetical protein